MKMKSSNHCSSFLFFKCWEERKECQKEEEKLKLQETLKVNVKPTHQKKSRKRNVKKNVVVNPPLFFFECWEKEKVDKGALKERKKNITRIQLQVTGNKCQKVIVKRK